MKKPTCIKSIWDNQGETFDRYSIVTSYPEHSGMYQTLALSEYPSSPNGFSQFGIASPGKHLGKRIKWESLSDSLKRHIIYRLSPEDETSEQWHQNTDTGDIDAKCLGVTTFGYKDRGLHIQIRHNRNKALFDAACKIADVIEKALNEANIQLPKPDAK